LIEDLHVTTYSVPTDGPESDGTLAWRNTEVVVVEVEAGGMRGLGYTYAHAAAGKLVDTVLREVLVGGDELATERLYERMTQAVRNLGHVGLGAMAVSAVDIALWDLKGKLLGQPLFRLLGAARDAVPVYGSGGFTSYDDARLASQLGRWASDGMRFVKMKIGGCVPDEADRVKVARDAIGPKAELFVDANGAYAPKEALRVAEMLAEYDVRWFEEPVSSDDLEGLAFVRDRAPACMDIAAGEYGWEPRYFERMLAARAVDVLQIDATRAGGVTGFMRAAALADAHAVPLSTHCAPAIHAQVGCAAARVRHLEWFYDHVRIERILFDGAVAERGGLARPDPSRPGLGLELRRSDARRYAVAI
jgi:L-alanine-DL-glutamate epimerase-like enolase superfamily enzyme